MKILTTIVIALINVTFGVKLGSVDKEQAATFYLLDSNDYSYEQHYESNANK